MNFFFRQIHLAFPRKHVLICEDVVEQQINLLVRLAKFLPIDGSVQVSILPGAIMAANLIQNCQIDLIIADHDMSFGNGTDLLQWMQKEKKKIPVITASGIPQNNDHMMTLGANYRFSKQEVIDGLADPIIKSVLGI